MTKLEQIFYDTLDFKVDESASRVEFLAKACAKACEEELRKAWRDGLDNGEARMSDREYNLMLENYLKYNYGITPTQG